MSGTDTGATVVNGLVGEGELTEVVTDHLGLDFNRVESLAVVDADDSTDHVGGDDLVAAVGADSLGLLAVRDVLLALLYTLGKNLVLEVDVAGIGTTGTGREEGIDLLLAEGEELLELDTTVFELTESTLLGNRGRHFYVDKKKVF